MKEYNNILKHYLMITEKEFNKKLLIPKIHFYKGISTVGYYDPNNNSLNFNKLYENQDKEKYLQYVVTHELAHYIVNCLYPNKKIRPHGKEFKLVCKKIFPTEISELIMNRTTNLFTKIKKNRWLYTCKCKEHKVTTFVHNKIEKGAKYTCKVCKNEIFFKEKILND